MGLGALRRWLRNPNLQFISACDPNKESDDYPLWGRPRGEMKGFNGGREVGKRAINEYYAEQVGQGENSVEFGSSLFHLGNI